MSVSREYMEQLRATIRERREALGGDTYAHANWIEKRRMTKVCVRINALDELLTAYENFVLAGTESPQRCECHARMAGECMCGAWR